MLQDSCKISPLQLHSVVPYKLSYMIEGRLDVFLLQTKTRYISSPFIGWIITTTADISRRLFPTTSNTSVSHTHGVWTPKYNDDQGGRNGPLLFGEAVQLTGPTSLSPQVDTFFLHMLDPLYTTSLPASYIFSFFSIYFSPFSLLLNLKCLKMSSASLGSFRRLLPLHVVYILPTSPLLGLAYFYF